MPTYHGVTVVLRIARLLAEGKIPQEYLGTLNGSGTDQNFYSKNFPITTDAGATTNDQTKVDVYTRVPPGTTWVELSDTGSDFIITGASGLVTIKAAKNQAGDAGKAVSISYYHAAVVARGQGESIDFASDLQEILEQGNRNPQELKEGHIAIGGTIDVLYVSADLLGKFLGSSDFYNLLADFSIYLYPNGNVSGQPYIKVANAKFSGGSIRGGLKAILAVNLRFKGLVLSSGTVA